MSARSHRILFIVSIMVLCASTAPGLTAADARCRKAVAVGAQKLASTVVAEMADCQAQILNGSLSATTDCSDPTAAGFPGVGPVGEAVAKLHERIQSRCAGVPATLGYASCASPCDADVPALDTMDDVARCLACQANVLAGAAIDETYGDADAIDGDAAECQNRIGRALERYAKKRMSKQRTCQYREDRNRLVADCKTADLTGTIARAAASADSSIDACTDSDLSALTSCATTRSAEKTCVRAAAEALTDSLFDHIFPVPPATPTVAATSTRTVTATVATATPTAAAPTRTPTSTVTAAAASPTHSTGSCPCANFLDVSSAPGAGGSYPTPSLSVSCNGSTVTVRSNSIPHYTFVQTTPNALQAQNYNFTFPQNPQVAANTTAVPLLGNIAVAVNGITIFGPNEAAMPDPYGDPVANAILDECLGHTGGGGAYHYHALLVKCLSQSGLVAEPWNNADPSPLTPSPIIAYAFDGFPIYGPYECSDADCTSVIEMKSGWDHTGTHQNVGCTSSSQCTNTTYTCAPVMISGVRQNACIPKTCAWSNNDFVARAGAEYLDQCNGHYGPNGDYHYHGTSTFPYILGCYRGTPTNNGGMGTQPGGTCS